MKIHINENQFILFDIDPDFYEKYGRKQYALYEWVADGEEDQHLATVWMPDDLGEIDTISTVSHEVYRFVTDYLQTRGATMHGKIMKAYMVLRG